SDEATIGGAIATNAFGPRRFGHGTLRDYLIGLTAVDAGGRIFHAGGRVVKNVAGYDLCKLLVGSWGTLAVLTQVTLKVVPIPEVIACVWSTWDSATELDAALASLNTSVTRPIALEILNHTAIKHVNPSLNFELPKSSLALAVLVAGSAADVTWQTQNLVEELKAHSPTHTVTLEDAVAEKLLQTLTENSISTSVLSFRAHLLPSRVMEFVTMASEAGCSVQSHAGNGIVMAHAPDDVVSADRALQLIQPLRQWVESQGGSLVIQRCPADWKTQVSVFGSEPSAWPLMKNLKHSLDPHNLLCPGRLFASEG
ncbi:MAG: FAD-binding oxidoreductase, partial [Planctomycetaceae bacterium]|nr:FAD-binding oxidoreductase [Planctomycetaceae bacterium]